ncbi:MAG: hypothetical protein R3C10_02690 [Pirellulales bacterium]
MLDAPLSRGESPVTVSFFSGGENAQRGKFFLATRGVGCYAPPRQGNLFVRPAELASPKGAFSMRIILFTAAIACALIATSAHAENIFADPDLWTLERADLNNPNDGGYTISAEDGLHMSAAGTQSARVYRDIAVAAGQQLTLNVAYDAQGESVKA